MCYQLAHGSFVGPLWDGNPCHELVLSCSGSFATSSGVPSTAECRARRGGGVLYTFYGRRLICRQICASPSRLNLFAMDIAHPP